MKMKNIFQRHMVKALALVWALVIAVFGEPSAEANRVRVDLEKGSLVLTSVTLDGAEYLPLANLARALGASVQRLPTPGRYRIRLPRSSI